MLYTTNISSNEVCRRIEARNFDTDVWAFYGSLYSPLARHPEMLSRFSPEALSGMRLFKVAGAAVGFALRQGNEIVAVHNHEPGVRGVGKQLVRAAVQLGGRRLDHMDTPALRKLYDDLGFEEVKRVPYDAAQDPSGLIATKHGEVDLVYRELTT